MQVTTAKNKIKLEFNYNPNIISQVKRIPGCRFEKNPISCYWTIPVRSVPVALSQRLISEGHLYPSAKNLINKNRFWGLKKIEIKPYPCRIRAFGPNKLLQELQQCLIDLCSYEEKIDNEYFVKSLADTLFIRTGLSMEFPNGLYERIKGYLESYRFREYIVHPGPPIPQKTLDLSIHGITARPYQREAFQRILNGQIKNRATLVMATGAGKTILSGFIAANIQVPTVFYTYSLDLLNQTVEVYEQLFQTEIGKIGGNKFTIKPITVATVQSVYKAWEKQDSRWDKLKEYLNTVELMFVDEGHMLGAETIFKVAQLTDAYYSYALTATPHREDGKKIFIEAGTGPAVELISEKELVQGGYVLPVEVELYRIKHYPSRRKKRYRALYDSEIIDHWERNRAIVKAVRSHQGKQVLILIQEIEHGKKLSEVLNVPFIHGRTPAKERKETLRQFKESEIDILIASSILKQGVDLPEAEVLILAHGGTSLVDLMQKIGRVRRPAPGKEKGIVIDFHDEIAPPDDKDILKAQSQKRLALYRLRGFNVVLHNN